MEVGRQRWGREGARIKVRNTERKRATNRLPRSGRIKEVGVDEG